MPTSKDTKVRPPNPKQLGLNVRGTFFLCPNMEGKPCALYVFQGVRAGLGNIPGYANKDRQMRRWVKPRDPKTTLQLFRRNIFRAAMMRWHEMDSREQATWRDTGSNKKISALNAWMAYALRGGLSV